ncbi:armadillo-type protein [Mycena leptocephala]|nr:armadillo-type protein [Mycena leptocephala]
MLRVVVPSGKARNSGAENSDEIQFIHQVLIQAGGPFHRWDHFAEHLRPLACALGIRLILATGLDDHTEQWEQRTHNLINMSEGGFIPHVRQVLISAAFEGLCVGQIRIRRTCTIILCKQFQIPHARSMLARAEPARMAKAMMSITGALNGADEQFWEVVIKGMMSLAKFAEFRAPVVQSMTNLIALLTDSDNSVRSAGADALAKLSEIDEFRPAIVDSIPKLVALLTDSDSNVRAAGADTLAKLSEIDGFRPTIVNCFPRLVTLLTDSDSNARTAGAGILAKLSEKDEFRPAIVVSSIPKLVTLLSNSNVNVRLAAVDALAKLSEKADISNSLALSDIHHIFPILLQDSNLIPPTCAHLFACLVTQGHLREMIVDILTLSLDALYSRDNKHSKRGADLIAVFTEYNTFAPILREIWPLYSFTQDFLLNVSLEQTNLLVHQMEFYGILKTL